MDKEPVYQKKWEDYARAEKFLPWNLGKRIYNAEVKPFWITEEENGEAFWYLLKSKDGNHFYLADPENDVYGEAFDSVKLAAALSIASGKFYEAGQLPFDKLEWFEGRNKIRFETDEGVWECDLQDYACEKVAEKTEKREGGLLSPDGKWFAFTRDYNIYLQDTESGEEVQLSTDGEKYWDYASSPESNTRAVTLRSYAGKVPPQLIWSPDSKKLLTQRLDQRKVKELHLLQMVPPEGQRPVLHTYRYAMPGDEELTKCEVVIFDIKNKSSQIAKLGEIELGFMGPVEFKQVWWSEDGEKIYFIKVGRASKKLELFEVDASSGESRLLITESSLTYAELAPLISSQPNVRVLQKSGAVVWYSERDGWANLYLYDLQSTQLKNRITSGPFVVYEIKQIDEEKGWIYFTAGCHEPEHDPYYRHLYRARLDGSEQQLLTPENGDHSITFSPSGNYFVDTYSRVDYPPTTNLRRSDGILVRIMEEADISSLEEMGWRAPLTFSVKARDNQTDLYGVIFRPSNFDSQKSYPVIDSIYPGPQHIRSPKTFAPDAAQALAELGFIVVTLDGLGNMGRSKAHHDLSYEKFTEAGGLEDHVYGLRQLAERYPYMDLNRVGIYGHSGGGFASTKAILTYPEFYKVAVSSAGNHDQRGYVAMWGELYNGLPKDGNYEAQANPQLAKNLKGRLLLAAGDMDDNVHPALTMQVVDALIKAGKDFDMLFLPNRNHYFSIDAYFIRRLWDYFVRYLLGEEPPENYVIDSSKIPPVNPLA